MNGFILADVASTALQAEDHDILKHPKIAGIVLFTRNYEDPEQLCALTKSIRKIRLNFIISVDQEGGRVQRFKKHFSSLPGMRHWGDLFKENETLSKQELTKTISLMAIELKRVGVNFDFLPVLDLDRNLNSVIGERSFSQDPAVVIELAKTVINVLHENHMPVIGKHFPGHGGVTSDSHTSLPVDQRDLALIKEQDMQPFIQLIQTLDAIMPAHVVFDAIDSMPATYSSYWLRDVLREQLKFEGVVISDDLTMAGAAQLGSYGDRALAAQEAGCDILTVCNNRDGVISLLDESALKPREDSNKRINILLQKMEGA